MLAQPLIVQLSDTQLLTLRVAIEEWASLLGAEPILGLADGTTLRAEELAARVPVPTQSAVGGTRLADGFVEDGFADMLALAVEQRGFDEVVRAFSNISNATSAHDPDPVSTHRRSWRMAGTMAHLIRRVSEN